MEKIFSQEILKMLGILGVAGIGLLTFTGYFIAKAKGSIQPYIKPLIIYLLVFLLLASLPGLSGMPALFKNPGWVSIVLQILFIGLGALHVRYLPRVHRWAGTKNSFWIEIVYTLVICAFAFIGFTIVFRIFNKEGYHTIMALALVWVPITAFIYHTFLKAIEIPVKIYSQWFYPLHREVDYPDEDKMKHMLIVSFMFQKKTDDTFFTNFRAKAPTDMDFGQLFYYFINDYNERFPNSKIEYVNTNGEPYGWFFYRKRKWYDFSDRFIDVDKTFFANGIRENDVIVCLRN